MQKEKKYNQKLDEIRILACLAVLFYHLGILKGGYLAVACFFVLSGYLSCVSSLKKEHFSFKEYYINRLKKLYLPLVLVVFLTLFIVSIFPKLDWLNLKPETTSVLLGYNNFWQLSANLDYFARHLNSPFMHFWYIAILIQFDLVFPFLYFGLKKLGDKVHKSMPCIVSILITLLSAGYFYKMSLTDNFMFTYYNTFTRMFSLFFGLSIGFIHYYYGNPIFKKLKNNPQNKIVFYSYLLILILLFIFIDDSTIYFAPSLLIVTIITGRLIEYSEEIKETHYKVGNILRTCSSFSYEVYLFQYPIIFFFQSFEMNTNLKYISIIALVFLISYLFHWSYTYKKTTGFLRISKVFTLSVIVTICILGCYYYINAKDHTKEMKQLEIQLAQNEKMVEEKQKAYQERVKEEENTWQETLENLEQQEQNLKEYVSKLSLVGVGDSVMLGAVPNLYEQFPNGYFDAKISRTAWVLNAILNDLKGRNLLGDPIIINLGANGDCSWNCKLEIIKICEDRKIFWVNTTNDQHVNATLEDLAKEYDNVYIVDWNLQSSGHPEYFVADGIHLTEIGKKAYTSTIYQAIYEIYSKDYEKKKEELQKEHEQKLKEKISFYGNDLLLNAVRELQTSFEDASFNVDSNFTKESLETKIETDRKENNLNHKIVLVFDSKFSVSKEDYQKWINLWKDYEIYIVTTNYNQELSSLISDNVKVIDFYKEIKTNESYLMADKIHLTENGNHHLSMIITETLK